MRNLLIPMPRLLCLGIGVAQTLGVFWGPNGVSCANPAAELEQCEEQCLRKARCDDDDGNGDGDDVERCDDKLLVQ